MKYILTIQELEDICRRDKVVVCTPDVEAAEVLFSVISPPKNRGNASHKKFWIDLVTEGTYNTIAYYIRNGVCDSYCGLDYFLESRNRGKYGDIYTLCLAPVYNVGDVVQIIENPSRLKIQRGVVSQMTQYHGKIATIVYAQLNDGQPNGWYRLDVDGGAFWWYTSCLTKIELLEIDGIKILANDNMERTE